MSVADRIHLHISPESMAFEPVTTEAVDFLEIERATGNFTLKPSEPSPRNVAKQHCLLLFHFPLWCKYVP